MEDKIDDFLGDSYDEESNTLNYELVEKNAFQNKETFNIILFGATGAGKSTLVNSFFGENLAATGQGISVTQHLTKIKSPKKSIVLWDTKGIEAKDYEATIRQLKTEIKESFDKAKHCNDMPHLGWLCIGASNSRIEPRDLELIKIVGEYNFPVIVVFTKIRGDSEKKFVQIAIEEINNKINDQNELNYVEVLADDYKSGNFTIPSHGMEKLLNISLELLPDGVKNAKEAIRKAQIVNAKIRLKAMNDSARSVVHVAATSAGAVGASPIPDSDTLFIVAIQSTMIYKISAEFKLNSSLSNVTDVVTGISNVTAITRISGAKVIVGATAIAQIGKAIVSNALKFIPIVGRSTGAVTSTAAIELTETAGHAYIKVLNSYYNEETASVELPQDVTSIISRFKEYYPYHR